MTALRIHLLGGFLLDDSTGNIPPIPSAVGRSLLAYLVTNRVRRHTRDLLAGTFWPELPESSARRRLSQALWQIQAVLNEAGLERPLVQATSSDVAFSAEGDYWLDVAQFDSHIAAASHGGKSNEHAEAAELEAAVGLYRGEFLAGFYEDWTTLERERLRGTYLTAVNRLIGIYKGRADYETGLSFAKRLTLHDPLRESGHREVMRLCFLLGRSNEALQHYERCKAMLAEELGAEPSTETEALRLRIEQLRSKGERPFAPTSRAPLLDIDRSIPLVGRDEERLVILRRIEETLLGRGSVVLVEGRSGIGKSRLLEELVVDAGWRGLSVMTTEGVEGEALYPLQGLRKAFESGLSRLRVEQLSASLHARTLADLAQIAPGIAEWLPAAPKSETASGGVTPQRLTQTIRATLFSFAELNPTVLFIDDAHWLDVESIAALASLLTELEQHGLLICLAYRRNAVRDREDLWSHLVHMDSVARAEKVRLDELNVDEVARLIEASLGTATVTRDVVEGLFLETGGNPLFILESLRSWHELTQREFGTESPELDFHATDNIPVAGGVAQVIRRRLSNLTGEVRTVLETSALLAGDIDATILARATDLTRRSALRALEELIRRGALAEGRLGYRFAHDQIRRVVLGELDPVRRGEIHLRIAESIELQEPHNVEALAHHFNAAQSTEKAYEYSIAGGRRARSLGAYDTAARHFERAASLDVVLGRFQLLCEWEDVLDVLGRRADQEAVLDELVTLAESSETRAEVDRRKSRLLANTGDYVEAVALADSAVQEAEEGLPNDVRGPVLQNLGLVLSHAGRPTDAVAPLESAVAAFTNDDERKVAALCDLGNVLCDAQEYERAFVILSQALSHYEQAEDPLGIAEASGQLAIVQMERGEGVAAIELYTRALQLARDLDYRRAEAVNLANLGNALYFQGTVGEALRRYRQAAEIFAAIGDRRGAALLRANTASVRHTIVGDDSVGTDVEASLAFFEEEGHAWGQAFCHELLAAIAHRRGDGEDALGHVRSGLGLLGETGHGWVEVHLQRLAARMHLESGDVEAAEKAAKRALDLCVRLGLNDVTPTVDSLRALISLERGDGEGALRLARSATRSLTGKVEQAYVVWYRRYLVEAALGRTRPARDSLANAGRLLDQVLTSLTPADRDLSRSLVPEHRRIFDTRDRAFPRLVSVELARLDAPTGRPLRPEETTVVRLTVSDPTDFVVDEQVARRRIRMRRLAHEAEEQGALVRIADLAELLEVSVATVRRDLAALRRSNVWVRTRGSS